MPDSCTHVYVHVVWATWDRLPLLTADIEDVVHRCISAKCEELGCGLVELGGTEDHRHALVRLHSTISVAVLAKGMKGASSHLVAQHLPPGHG